MEPEILTTFETRDLTRTHTCGITVINGAALCVDDMHCRAASFAPFSSLLLRHLVRSLQTLKQQGRMGQASQSRGERLSQITAGLYT